jgi:hypothetical protein
MDNLCLKARVTATRSNSLSASQRAGRWIILVGQLISHPVDASVLREDFSSNPFARGWSVFGDSSLFNWDAGAQVLAVTWDSSRSNSFFHLPLGRSLTMADDFSFSFDLRLQDIRAGSTPGKSNEFEIAIGLLNRATATQSNAFRGAGQSSTYGVRNVIELDYFPDAGFGDTVATTVISTNNRIFPAHNFPLTLRAGDVHRFTIAYSASDRLVRTTATRNGEPFGMAPDHTLASVSLTDRPDFLLDAFGVLSYSDAVQTGPLAFHGSVLAHGTVDNIELILPTPPVRDLRLSRSPDGWEATFEGAPGWTFALRRSIDLQAWSTVATVTNQTSSILRLVDTNPPGPGAFYRIEATRP